jgi:hypothetical protein
MQLYIQFLFHNNLFYVYSANYHIFHFSQTNEPKGRNMDF